MVLNGNVTSFTVSNNSIHDNNNIGIDFIGFEGTGSTGNDQARSGVCVGNTVYNISSATNPTYGGDRSADGIYVDGGKDIVIERNKVDNNDIGIEVASEHQGKTTSNITVRNNFVSRSYQANVLMGGYAANKGNAANVVVVKNTLFQGGDGEVALQYNCNGVTVKNNLCYAKSGNSYLVNEGSNNSNVNADYNLYYGASTSSPGSWSDAHATYANPMLITPYSDMHIGNTSPAVDSGVDLGTVSGTVDIEGEARVQGGARDIGVDEIGSALVSVTGGNVSLISISLPVGSTQ